MRLVPKLRMHVLSLFKQLHLDPKSDGETYIETLCSSMLNGSGDASESNDESRFESLNGLIEDLNVKYVLPRVGLTPSKADIVVYAAMHSFVHLRARKETGATRDEMDGIYPRLLVEEIDIGGPNPRQVVSSLEDMTNRLVVLITNVKAGKLRDVVSEGLVLGASNEDQSVVEPLIPPEGAKVGERVSFTGNDGTPETVI